MLPFCVNRLFGTMVDTYGTLIAEDQGLKVVFQEGVQEDINPFDANVRSVTLPWSQVVSLRGEQGILSTTLEIAVTDSPVLEKLPFADDGKLKLTIRSKDVAMLQPFLSAARARKSGTSTSGSDDDTDDFIDEMRDFLWDL